MQKVTEDNKSENYRIDQKSRLTGRIVIPKELLFGCSISSEGSPLEIYMDADETIVLKKIFAGGKPQKKVSQAYAQSLSVVTGATVCVADRMR